MPTRHFLVHPYETSDRKTLDEEEVLSFSFNEQDLRAGSCHENLSLWPFTEVSHRHGSFHRSGNYHVWDDRHPSWQMWNTGELCKNQSVIRVLLSHLTYDDCRTELLRVYLQHREEQVVPLVSWDAFFFQQPCECRFSLHFVTASFSAGCQSRLCSSHEYTMPPFLSTPNLYLEI